MSRGSVVLLSIVAAGVVLIALVGALGVAMSRGVGDSPLGVTDPGISEATPFTLPLMNAPGEFVLAEHAGRPVFLYFWASWCGPCEQEAPVIQELWPEYRDRGYTFVGVNILDIESDARDFVERHGLTFPVVRDDGGDVYLDYGVYGLPEAFFVRPGLEVQTKYNGPLDEDDLRELLATLEEPS